ncbi:MAG: restriction endonuclease, partial [Solirubrobacterales bacterium]
FDSTTQTLVEAKGTVERNAVRMAIGQLLDYRRFFGEGELDHIAALFPKEPRPDLVALLHEQGIVVIYRAKDGFEDSTGGGLVND